MTLFQRNTEEAVFDRRVVRVIAMVLVAIAIVKLVDLLAKPLLWLVLACVLAIAAAGPVNWLARHMKRGYAIAIVYLSILLIPAALGAILLPPIVSSTADLVQDLPQYVRDFRDTLQKNESFRKLDENFNINEKLSEAANKLSERVGDAASILADLGTGALNSIFAGITILALSIFMVSRGRRWVDAMISTRAGPEAESWRRTADRVSRAVSGYIIGALAQAFVAGLCAFIVLSILGVPSPLALAAVVAIFDLIPLVGASIAAVIVGVVTLFADFPIDLIVWAIFAIAFQQFENYVIQPQIQRRAVALDPFIVLLAVIVGGTLMGVLGAVMAIPIAATIQIAYQEYRAFDRRTELSASASETATPT